MRISQSPKAEVSSVSLRNDRVPIFLRLRRVSITWALTPYLSESFSAKACRRGRHRNPVLRLRLVDRPSRTRRRHPAADQILDRKILLDIVNALGHLDMYVDGKVGQRTKLIGVHHAHATASAHATADTATPRPDRPQHPSNSLIQKCLNDRFGCISQNQRGWFRG
jgi:hypothetical protein